MTITKDIAPPRPHERAASSGPWGRLAPIVLFVVAALVAAQSARMGLSGLIVELGQAEQDRWVATRRPPGLVEANRVAGYFAASLSYYPGNPWALEELGGLDLRRMRLSRKPGDALAFARAARLRFREGLRQRPTSPFLWANLALAKLYLDELDAEFLAALTHADELGPWEPASQQVVLVAGLAAWDKLDAAQRRLVVGVVERGAVRNSVKMFEILRNFGRFDLVCARRSYDSVAANECGKRAAPVPGRGLREWDRR